MEQSQSNETFDQKVIRNVQAGGFAVYKTPDVVGAQTLLANLEWEDPEQVDKFFAFAKSLGAKVIYVAERDEEDDSGNSKTSLAQVGFVHQGIMHHINLEEPDDDEEYEDDDEQDEYEEEYDEDGEYDDAEDGEYEEEPVAPQPTPQAPVQQVPQQSQQPQQPVAQPTQQAPSQGQAPAGSQQPWPKPQY